MSDEKGKPYLEGKKILAVDDFEKWLKVVKHNAEYYGAREKDIFFAYNIQEGKRIYTLEKPRIVVSDINFAADDSINREGLELISFMHRAKLKEGNFSRSLLSIVAMSSLDPEIEKATKFAGADYFINKRTFSDQWDSCVKQMHEYWKFLGRVAEIQHEERSTRDPFENLE